MEVNGQESNPQSETLKQLQAMRNGETLPESEAPEAEAVPEQRALSESEIADAPASEAIVVDGQQFASEKEAYAYVQKKLADAETEKLLLQARQEGLESALQYQQAPQSVTPAVPVVVEDDSDQFYADPQGYLKRKTQDLESQIEQRITAKMQQQQQDANLWTEFFTTHPDLADSKKICELALNENIETIKVLAIKDRKRAMDYLATKTREVFQGYNERLKPRQTLTNTKAGPSVGNIGGGVTPALKNNAEEPIDFVSQMLSLRR